MKNNQQQNNKLSVIRQGKFLILKLNHTIITRVQFDIPYKRLVRRKRRNEYRFAFQPLLYKLVLDRMINHPMRKKKRKKRQKSFVQLRRLNFSKKLKLFFKRMIILKRMFIKYYVKLGQHNFRRIQLYYKIFNDLTKFEKFLYYFESRLPAIIVRMRFSKTQQQSVRFVMYGGVRVNGFIISYIDFLTKLTDLVELAFRYYRFVYTKRYVKYRKFRRRIFRRSFYIRFYKKVFKFKFFRKKRLFTLNYITRFFEKSRRVLAAILIRFPYKTKYRRYSKMLPKRNLTLLAGFSNN
jgi:ribosomal protein S4